MGGEALANHPVALLEPSEPYRLRLGVRGGFGYASATGGTRVGALEPCADTRRVEHVATRGRGGGDTLETLVADGALHVDLPRLTPASDGVDITYFL